MVADKFDLTSHSDKDLIESGVKARPGTDPKNRGHDLLERYLAVPNHAIFLFTSEDTIIERYIRVHWAALDGLTGEFCDVHVSVLQLKGMEDAYTQIAELKSIPGCAEFSFSQLPALHLWSQSAWLTIPLVGCNSEEDLRDLLRLVFSFVRTCRVPLSAEHSLKLQSLIGEHTAHRSRNSQIFHQEVYMESKYKVTGGNVAAMGDNARAEHFQQLWNASEGTINLAALADELPSLSSHLVAEANMPQHYAAIGEVKAAEIAAKDNNGASALEHLKKAGGWIWDVATKVGIGVATAAAKAALGL